jgi:hypothetical protein
LAKTGSDWKFRISGRIQIRFRKCQLYCLLYLLVIERCKKV